MKKIAKSVCILFLFSVLLFSLCSCNNNDYKNSQINNKVFSKEVGIEEIKELLQVDSIYFFDCDFSSLSDVTIVDSSYNISVWGQFIYDKELERQVIDLSKQATVELVANYKIESNSTCFGFSVVSEVMSTGSKNEIFTANTFKSFADLQGENGGSTIYETNVTINNIKVPSNFYPKNLKDSINPTSYYRKYEGMLYNIKVLYTPIYVATHYEDYASYKADSISMMQKIDNYMVKNAIYRRA